MGTTLERLQEEVGSEVGDVELMELHEKIKTESMGMGEQVDGINSHLQSLTFRDFNCFWDSKFQITNFQNPWDTYSNIFKF